MMNLLSLLNIKELHIIIITNSTDHILIKINHMADSCMETLKRVYNFTGRYLLDNNASILRARD